MAPQRYLEVQRAHSSRLRTTSAALASSLAWLPLLIPSIGTALTPTNPRLPLAPPLLIAASSSGWLLTLWLDWHGVQRVALFVPVACVAAALGGGVGGSVAGMLAAGVAFIIANQVNAGGAFTVALVAALTQGVSVLGGQTALVAGGVGAIVAFFVAVIVAQRAPLGMDGRGAFIVVGGVVAGAWGGLMAGVALAGVALLMLGVLLTVPDHLATTINRGYPSRLSRALWLIGVLANGLIIMQSGLRWSF